ncbi:hypothetical protein HFO56_24495 [Rhizobium laguerreae]|uniref:hypothetical protein n=1 Tax=Rhizobium laguerreae TaxID=1076926 RepID=UPI001C8FE223|nr:hypothetical protein [Rhizobium laguerreae]MBY3155491.1 hypothetical protein [Rhizobium laguerreae]
MSRAPKVRRADLCARVVDVLTPELLTGRWKTAFSETGNRYAGHCYAAAEAIFHMVGGRTKGWLPCVMSHATWSDGLAQGETHWFVRHERTGEILDPTAPQFDGPVPYERSKGCGFLTREPSRRARVIMQRLGNGAAAA